MFIETLEFTIPVDLCDLFSNLKQGPRSNVEFPASVNSYGTTQDANIQVVLRANKLTFKVDGVSSNSSMISKSECKTLKLSVFDVDCSQAAQDVQEVQEAVNSYELHRTINMNQSNQMKRSHDYSVQEYSPQHKSSRTSYSESRNIPSHQSSRHSNQSQSKPQNDTPVNVKQEPEDPDLIEIEPDEIEPKKEVPYMQIDYSSDVPHTQTSQSALERLSHPQSSHSQSPGSSSSSFHQNVPHVPDYSEPGPSQHGQSRQLDQSADDFLVFQDDDGEDNEADYSNDEISGRQNMYSAEAGSVAMETRLGEATDLRKRYPCPYCGKMFIKQSSMKYHQESIHEGAVFNCVCGKVYKYRPGLISHRKQCVMLATMIASNCGQPDLAISVIKK